jgi:hypothetical protein
LTGRIAKFKAGNRWSPNFDYGGMLKAGMSAKVSDGPVKLRKLFNSFEDVNYHTESAPLWDAIEYIKAGKPASAKMRQFNKNCERTYNRLHKFGEL